MQTALIERILFIRWTATPDAADISRLDPAIQEAMAAAGSEPWFHISVLSAGIEMPERRVQKGLLRRVLKMRGACGSLHAVYLGGNLRDAVIRRFLKGMATFMGMKGKAFVHATVEEAVAALDGKAGGTSADIVARARQQGIIPA